MFVSSDTWPGTGGVLGLTKAGIAEAKAKGVQPAGGGGFAYLRGPDDALIEYRATSPRERFNHIHMYQEEPFCAQLWYQRHLNQRPPAAGAPAAAPPRTEANCRVERGADQTWPALEPRRHVPHAVADQHGVQRRVALRLHEPVDRPLASRAAT